MTRNGVGKKNKQNEELGDFMGKYLQHPSVRRVISALFSAGYTKDVIELEETARSAEEAAKALGVNAI